MSHLTEARTRLLTSAAVSLDLKSLLHQSYTNQLRPCICPLRAFPRHMLTMFIVRN